MRNQLPSNQADNRRVDNRRVEEGREPESRSANRVANRYNVGRPVPDILANPIHGETVPAASFGKISRNRYIWVVCPTCGWARWVVNRPMHRNAVHCRKCVRKFMDCRKYKPDAKNGSRRTIQPTTTPKIGDIIRGADIGRGKNKIYVWLACPDCSKRPCWVVRRSSLRGKLCVECVNKSAHKASGPKSGAWKGGRRTNPEGYMMVRISQDSPFYSMSQRGLMLEHRLVMAKHLGRCLHSWEIVHHKHTKFPLGSLANKQDNRLENLELIQMPLKHCAITLLEKKAAYLVSQVEVMKVELRLQKWQIKELTEHVRILSTCLKRAGSSQ